MPRTEFEPPEPAPPELPLRQVLGIHFPYADVIALPPYAERWSLTDYLEAELPIYVGAWRQPRGDGDEIFRGLPQKVNRDLQAQVFFTFFQPILLLGRPEEWASDRPKGFALEPKQVTVHVRPIGQARVWHGRQYAVIWSCYWFPDGTSQPAWKERLGRLWRGLERTTGAAVFFTVAQELEWPENRESYRAFLSQLGYAARSRRGRWWSKSLSAGTGT